MIIPGEFSCVRLERDEMWNLNVWDWNLESPTERIELFGICNSTSY